MSLDWNFVSRIEALLREELTQEANAGFPTLLRIPSTGTIRLLDYFATLSSGERNALIEAFARSAALQFFPAPLIANAYEDIRTTDPAFVRFGEALRSPRYTFGARYTGLRMTRAMLNDRESMAHLAQTYATLEFVPRDDPPSHLVADPDLSHVAAAKAPQLRKLLRPMLEARLSAKGEKQPGGDTVYKGAIEKIPLKVVIAFSNLYAQMSYAVTWVMPERTILAARLTVEKLWAVNIGWDYMTEENAARSIELLDELLVALAKLMARVAAL